MTQAPDFDPTTGPIAITMGDACGIGPEIIAKLAREPDALAGCLVIGDVGVLRRAASVTGGLLAVAPIAAPQDLADVPPRCLAVLSPPELDVASLASLPVGRVDARAGAAAAVCIGHAVALASRGAVRGIVTAPIHKEALAAAGVP